MTLGSLFGMTLGFAVVMAPITMRAQADSSMPGMQPAGPGAASTPMNSHNTDGMNPNVPRDSSSGMGNEAQVMKDKMFVRKAAEGGLAEVQLGQLAAQKASSDDVKQFGQKMVVDHTMLNDTMKPIADNMGVMLPKKMSKKDQDEYDKLNALSGTDFDKAYLAAMVMDHRKDMHEFRMEEMEATDPALKDAVLKGMSVIGDHMKMVNGLAKANGVDVPRGHQPPAM